MLYQITDGTVSAGGRTILSHIDFEIKGKEKIAVVGRNGAGKTTLLRLIAGELELDRDDRRAGPGIRSSRRLTVGLLSQTVSLEGDRTVEELILENCPAKDAFSKERFFYETEYDKLFTGFGFEKSRKKQKLSEFSGGEQTKISLIRLLLMKPDLLLLDEPTNHLDVRTVEWLEEYMRGYENAVVLVSHDRFFLDQVVDVVCELSEGRLRRYPGSYTQYRKQKQKELELAKKAYLRQQQELKRLDGLVQQFKNKPRKAAFARSRKTIMERMERLEQPREDEAHIFTGDIEPEFLGSKWALEAERVKIGYDRPLLELTLRVRRGQKIGILGENGVGKSTFLKTAAGLLEPLDGKCALGNHTKIGYFDQNSAAISSERTVAEHFRARFPAMTEKEVRSTLGAYLFRGRDAAKRVSDLSGGEKARLVLAELLCSRPNLLILDEPTNHMDIPAKETLESAFRAYTGTILFVSHDRYFIRQVADAVLVFENGTAGYDPFGYEHYLRQKRSERGGASALRRAEEQAMLEGLAAVPPRERHMLREIGTEDAYAEWRLSLAAEPMEDAKEEVGLLWRRREALREEIEPARWRDAADFDMPPEEADRLQKLEEEYEKLETALMEAWERWSNQCIAWYDVWNSLYRAPE